MISLEKIILIFKENAIIHTDCAFSGDNKKGNRAFDKISRIYHKLLDNPELIKDFIDRVMLDPDYRVAFWSSTFCLAFNYREKEAIALFESYLDRKDVDILSFNAEYTLIEYRKNGRLWFK